MTQLSKITISTPNSKSKIRRSNSSDKLVDRTKKFGLTPIIEDLAELNIESTVKKSKDDFKLVMSSGKLAKQVSKSK